MFKSVKLRINLGRAAPADSTDGCLDFVSDKRIYGWASKAGKPTRALVYVNDSLVASVKATSRRPDLRRVGISPRSGFDITLSDGLRDGDVVRATFDDGKPLDHSPITWHAPACETAKAAHLDLATTREVLGWAAIDGEPAEVSVFLNGEFFTAIKGGYQRPDLQTLSICPDAGFRVAFDRALRAGDRVRVAFIDGTSIGEQEVEVLLPPPYEVAKAAHLDRVTTREVLGWAAIDGEPAEVSIFINAEFFTTVKGGYRRPDLKKHSICPDAGFRVKFDRGLRAGDRVRVAFIDGTSVGERKVKLLRAAGHLDAVADDRIYGWAQMESGPDKITVCVNDKTIGQVCGGHFRKDVAKTGFDGRSGFALDLPQALQQGDKVDAYFSDGRPLQRSPWIYKRPQSFKFLPRRDNDRMPLFFIHIPKTAGTSLRRFIDQHAPDRLAFYNGELGNFDLMIELRKSRLPKLIIGHFPFGTHQYVDAPPNYTCVLRNPVDRVISLYRYARTLPEPAFWPFKNYDLKPLIELGITEQTNNHMCRLCAGVSTPPGVTIRERWLLECALHNIDLHFAFVGSLSKLPSFINKLCDHMDWHDIPITSENVTKGANYDIDESTLACVREYNSLDHELMLIMEARSS